MPTYEKRTTQTNAATFRFTLNWNKWNAAEWERYKWKMRKKEMKNKKENKTYSIWIAEYQNTKCWLDVHEYSFAFASPLPLFNFQYISHLLLGTAHSIKSLYIHFILCTMYSTEQIFRLDTYNANETKRNNKWYRKYSKSNEPLGSPNFEFDSLFFLLLNLSNTDRKGLMRRFHFGFLQRGYWGPKVNCSRLLLPGSTAIMILPVN